MEKCLKQEQKKKENLEVEIQSLEIETEVMKCEKCDFRTNSKRGFKTHIRRKHTVQDLISFPCEFCDFETNIKIQLKRHMKGQTYTEENDMWK